MQPTRFRQSAVHTLAAMLLGWAPLVSSAAVAAESAEQGEELLLFQEIPSVFSASKYEQKVTEAPSAVSIVTAAEIKKYGYRTLADLLRSLRSFHLSFERTNESLGVRGFNRPGDSNSRVLLLVNGHRVNDNIFQAASTGTAFILDVDLIDRVEVVRGPSSSLYGASAFFAVINVVTKRGRDLKGVEIAAEAGSHETWRGRLSYGERLAGGLEMLLSGTRYESDGNGRLYYPEFDSPDTNGGIAEDADKDEFSSLFARFSLFDFTLEGAYIERVKRAPTAHYGTVFNDPRNEGRVRQAYARLSYEHRFEGQLDVQAAASYNLFHSDGDYVYDYSAAPPPFLVINKDEFRGEWWGGEVQITKRLLQRHKLILGGEYQNNFRQDQKNYDLAVYLDTRNNADNWGAYLQDEIQLGSNLILNLGVRHDHYETFGGTTNPRLALIYNPFEKTTFKLLYGQAFRAPNAFENYYHDGYPDPLATQRPNPDLDPERIKTYELVFEQYLGDHLRAVVAGFYYEIDDLINLNAELKDPAGDPDDPANIIVFFDNLDKVEARGLELELEGKWDRGLEGRISYTFQEAKDEETDKLLSNSPKHLAKLNLIVPLYRDKLLLGIEEQYTSKRKTVSREETGGYAVTNLTLFGRKLFKGLVASASVYNLFDKKFSDPASEAHLQETIEQDGRLFRFKLTYAF